MHLDLIILFNTRSGFCSTLLCKCKNFPTHYVFRQAKVKGCVLLISTTTNALHDAIEKDHRGHLTDDWDLPWKKKFQIHHNCFSISKNKFVSQAKLIIIELTKAGFSHQR